jgi:hypothetical protein
MAWGFSRRQITPLWSRYPLGCYLPDTSCASKRAHLVPVSGFLIASNASSCQLISRKVVESTVHEGKRLSVASLQGRADHAGSQPHQYYAGRLQSRQFRIGEAGCSKTHCGTDRPAMMLHRLPSSCHQPRFQ